MAEIFTDSFLDRLKREILKAINAFLNIHDRPKPRILGLMTAQQVMEELGIKQKTLYSWERAGLKRYQPPIEDTRKVFYKVSDILIFLGVDEGENRK